MQIRQAAPSDRPATAAPGVVTLEFAECDQFAEAIRHEDIEVVQTVGGRFSNQIFLIPLAGALVRYGCHQSPWLCSATALPGHVSVVLDAVSEGPTLQNGQAIYEAQALGLYGSGAEHVSRSSPGEYFYAPFSEARFQAAWQAATGQETPVRADEFRRVRPEGRRWQALLELIAALRRQAEHAPDAFHDPIIRGAVERSLLSAVVLAVAADQDRTKAPANQTSTRSRFALVRRAQEHLRAHAHQPVYVLDLCAATGVSERTLRDAFLEQCGMGPIRYLKLRRLHEVRRTLRATAPETTSVKAVALANGFWELGRFAVDYRQSFGESPSQTLQRAARPIE